jgi:hypothetical protein
LERGFAVPPAVETPAAAFLIQCNPTATECAQIVPHSRDSRQEQMFSTSMGPLMTNPARKDTSPAWTTPLSNGGLQFELSTWSCSR